MITKADRLSNVQEYYFSRKLREVQQLKAAGNSIISLAIGSPDLEPPQEVLLEVKNALDQEGIHGYQHYQGIPELRQAIGDFYQKEYGVDVEPDKEVLPLMGSKEGILHIAMAFLNPGDLVLIPNPGYPTYTSVTNLVGAEPIYYDLNAETGWLPDYNALSAQDLEKVKIMWVNYPHMPTGANASHKDFTALVAFAKKYDILLVNDNPYSFVLNDEPLSILSVPGSKEVALELNSFSKTFNMAGWRVGMLLGNANYLKSVLEVKSNMDSGMFYALQWGAIKALQLEKPWYQQMNAIYAKRRTLVWKILDVLHCTYDKDTSGMFVWAKVPGGSTCESMADDLLYNKHIFITPGSIFGKNGEGYVRLSLCISEENLLAVLERLQ